MRLAIINLTGGGFSEGYKKYLKNMLPRLAEHSDVEALLCVSPEGNDVSSWFETPPAAKYCTCNPLTLRHLAPKPDKKLEECLQRFEPDIIFMPVERYIEFRRVPVVNMVRNMEPFMPNMKGDPMQEKFKRTIQRKLTFNSVNWANRTIAVSGFVKDYLTDKLRVAESKVSQVYHGITQQPTSIFKRPPSIPNGWDDGFLFTCGSIRPARGLEDALKALSVLKMHKLKLRLVIAGKTVAGMRKYRKRLEKFVLSRGLMDSICWAGNLNDDEMSWSFANCRLFVMTSRIEACPNIALEAMSHGAVSIAADNPPLPEIFSECAIYYEPGNSHSLAEAIVNRMALNSSEQTAISQRSRQRSSTFSWDLTADQTMTVLAQVLKQSMNRNRS